MKYLNIVCIGMFSRGIAVFFQHGYDSHRPLRDRSRFKQSWLRFFKGNNIHYLSDHSAVLVHVAEDIGFHAFGVKLDE
jgi:hypothetical protein